MKRAKARLPFGDEMLLQRMVRLIAPCVEKNIVVATPGQRLPALPNGVMVVRDPISWQGPLRGFLTGLDVLDPLDEWVFLSGCDAPFLQPKWIDALRDEIGEADAAVPYIDGFFHPLAGFYHTRVKSIVGMLLSQGERRFQALFDHCRVKPVDARVLQRVDTNLSSLVNINTPSAYRDALDRFAHLENGQVLDLIPGG